MIETLPARVNDDPALIRRGRFINVTLLLEVGDQSWLIVIAQGRILAVTPGPFVMPTWAFAMRAPAEAWAKFWAANPEPGFHDLFALIKKRLLVVEGDLHCFMSNLFYFKGLFATLRET